MDRREVAAVGHRLAVGELAKAQVEQSEASLRELRIQQEQTRIYSPLDGYIRARHLEPGSLVSPSVSILSVLNLDRVKTIVGVSERALHEVQVGLKAQIEVDAFADHTYSLTCTNRKRHIVDCFNVANCSSKHALLDWKPDADFFSAQHDGRLGIHWFRIARRF